MKQINALQDMAFMPGLNPDGSNTLVIQVFEKEEQSQILCTFEHIEELYQSIQILKKKALKGGGVLEKKIEH